jgi:hypothetical protein
MGKRAQRVALTVTALTALSGALFGAPAFSQPAKPQGASTANVVGAWTFQTQTYADGCKMYGELVIQPNASGKHICTFKTEEHCPDILAKAQESCTAQRNGATLAIKSTVLSVSPPNIGYDPDDFELKIENSARMTGMMRSFHSAPVEFYRGNLPTS